jgi:hypothetical protein
MQIPLEVDTRAQRAEPWYPMQFELFILEINASIDVPWQAVTLWTVWYDSLQLSCGATVCLRNPHSEDDR